MELWCIEYARNFRYATEKTVFQGSETDGLLEGFVFTFHVLVDADRCILVDTGFRDPDLAAGFGISLHYSLPLLESITGGREIDTILITHDHFDHTGNLDLFGDCRIILHRDELASLAGDAGRSALVALKETVPFDREFPVAPGVRMFHAGGHTPGSSAVEILHKGTRYMIAGDECYSLRNIRESRPIGNHHDLERNRAFIGKLADPGVFPLVNHDTGNIRHLATRTPGVYRIF